MSVSRNPFAQPGTQYVHPEVQAAAYQYPDISGGSYGSQNGYQQQQFSGQQQQYPQSAGSVSGMYGQQQPQYQQQPQQQQQWSYGSGSGVGMGGMPSSQQGLPSQNSNIYGQQYSMPSQSYGAGGGVDMGGMGTQMGYTGYQNGGYGYGPSAAGTAAGGGRVPNPAVSAFDPLSQQPQQPTQQQQQAYQQPRPQQEQVKMQPGLMPTISNYGAPDSKYNEHPRQLVIRTKRELEAWNEGAWNKLIECVEALREAWQARKAYLDQLPKQWPGINIDVPAKMKEAKDITAVRWQLAEIKNSYRHSHDSASRNRVKEQLNAGLSRLPDWPERTDELRNSLPELLARQRIPPNALSPPPPQSPLGLPQIQQPQYSPQQYAAVQPPMQTQQAQGPQMWTPQGQLTVQQYQQMNMQQQQQQQQQHMMGQYSVQAAPSGMQYGWR
ncbi:hypothetical protein DACRYDRAFT_118931 [Dacryopinax primogenitus]|uniref:Uncharacterized protein n=1 Tax=Dacryopinax primogenitus (strain DJM 731) TaxID=1858805 RepID=M5FSM9_DACPD|nr:uncharacterized protein DACRYDRAFT_118931 [Dacryopinax primogenitus]EJT98209.1 hypothetical protein DACRYDRAFT_118931 [Dacryopinax primogenitus]